MADFLRYPRASHRLSAEQRAAAYLGLVEYSVPQASAEALDVNRYFADEFVGYSELILSQDGNTVGFLVRGETAEFTRKIQQVMYKWGLVEAAMAHLRLAEFFDHKRAFAKFEWERKGNGYEHRIAVYYRRRPDLEQALDLVGSYANNAIDLAPFRELAGIVQKKSVHFVALAADSRNRLRHKMYFTQYLTPDTHDVVKHNVQSAFARFSSVAASACWESICFAFLRKELEQTLFLSVAVAKDGIEPSLKLDLPNVDVDLAVSLLPPVQRRQAVKIFTRLCHTTYCKKLSYFGTQWSEASSPTLKGYAAFP